MCSRSKPRLTLSLPFLPMDPGAHDGGDSSSVQDQLKNVQSIQAATNAFAAIVGDGSVVMWGQRPAE